jgi:uncharacterized protein
VRDTDAVTRPVEIEQADLILLLLAAETRDPDARFKCEGITRLEKLLFLLEKETDIATEISEGFAFEPYHFGPYSKEVYDAVDFLEALRLLTETRVDASSGLDIEEEIQVLDESDLNEDGEYILRRLELSKDGKDIARILSQQLSPKGKKAMSDIKERYGSMPLRQLLRYVYSSYPDYAEKSKIRDSVL